jgi:hypothetical protein
MDISDEVAWNLAKGLARGLFSAAQSTQASFEYCNVGFYSSKLPRIALGNPSEASSLGYVLGIKSEPSCQQHALFLHSLLGIALAFEVPGSR